jgi:aromatic-L-amino-acid/L-tryptophan decarboxylase
MNLKRFRADGAAALEWVSRYLEQIEKLPVLSQVKPGDVRRRLPAAAPEEGEPFDAVLRDLDEVIVPGITHWQSPNFYAFFPGNHSPPGILGDLVSSGIGVQGMLWISSPACTELEAHMLDWLIGLLDLPAGFLSTGKGGGVIQDTASSAILCAMLARDRLQDERARPRRRSRADCVCLLAGAQLARESRGHRRHRPAALATG